MNNKIQLYELACNLIVEEIEQKHEIAFSFWVGDIVGYVAVFNNDITIGFDDLLYDLKEELPDDAIKQWWGSYTSRCQPYQQWCKSYFKDN